MQAYVPRLERKTFSSAGCSEARITRKCVQLRGVIKGREKTKGHHAAENSCYYTMAKVQKKSFVCNFTPNFLFLVILLFHQSNSQLPNYQYHVDSMVDTRKGLLNYFAEKAGGCWILACTEYATRTQL